VRDAVALIAERTHGKDVLFLALGDDALSERIGAAEVRFIPSIRQMQKLWPAIIRRPMFTCMLLVPIHFPTPVLEALACCTLVVATAIGGIPEQVEDGRTGSLVSAGNPRALAERMLQLLSDHQLT